MKQNQSFIFSPGEMFQLSSLQVWWVASDTEYGCNLEVMTNRGAENIYLKPGETAILGINSTRVHVLSGKLAVLKANVIALAKLQAFIDTATGSVEKNNRCQQYGFALHLYRGQSGKRLFENWLIAQSVLSNESNQSIVSMLRNTEWYWVVSYLLSSGEGAPLKKLGARYGLSVSHFRRLSKEALGNTAKVEMCNWRLTRALMDLMDKKMNLTDVALKNGYASLSHFSNDVKNVFGVSPRQLKNIINCD